MSEGYRQEVRAWLEENCPESMRTPTPQDEVPTGGKRTQYKNRDTRRWMELCAGKGFTARTWPVEYGGAGMNSSQQQVFRQEMARINARQPLVGMGLSMIVRPCSNSAPMNRKPNTCQKSRAVKSGGAKVTVNPIRDLTLRAYKRVPSLMAMST